MFTSYAQNLEDVLLWRALRDVGDGFYIDVGANHPFEDSVTLGFYEQGWHGINVEPVASHIEELRRERQRDVNLQVGLGSKAGVMEFFETDRRGLSTLLPEIAEAHRRSGLAVKSYHVPIVTLAQVCEAHAPGDIHFLKIDVEGAERDVLEGADFKRFRPWIVVIEATLPNSREPRYDQWEHLLLAAGYAFAYFDGLNRFYALADRPDLLDALRLPPNVHDAYTFRLREGHYFSYPLDRHLQRIEDLGAELRRLNEHLERQAATTAVYLDRLRERDDQLQQIYASRSWRMTAPLRAAAARVRALVAWARRHIGRSVRFAVRMGKALARRVPVLKAAAGWALRRSTFLNRQFARFSVAPAPPPSAAQPPIRDFEQLRSVRIMRALSKLPAHGTEESITFLEVSDDVR